MEERYEKQETIGEGTYGVVYKGIDKQNGRVVAIKKVKLEQEEDEGIPSTTLREVSALKQLTHPNVVELLDVIVQERKIYLIFEYIENDLRKFLNTLAQPLHPHFIQYLMHQILQGVHFMHLNGIIHRDLKPQNILINSQGILKIADLGLARNLSVSLTNQKHPLTVGIVTLWYRSPELLLGEERYGEEIDSWAIGCIFAELFLRKPIFMGDSQIGQLFHIFQFLGMPDVNDDKYKEITSLPHYSPAFPQFKAQGYEMWPQLVENEAFQEVAKDLLTQLLVLDPKQRATPAKALHHPYFKQTFNN